MRRALREGIGRGFQDEDGDREERRRREEVGGEVRFGGGEEIGEVFEDGHLVD